MYHYRHNIHTYIHWPFLPALPLSLTPTDLSAEPKRGKLYASICRWDRGRFFRVLFCRVLGGCSDPNPATPSVFGRLL